MRKPASNTRSSTANRPRDKGKRTDAEKSKLSGLIPLLKRVLGEAAEVRNRKFLVASLLVHVLVIAAFLVNWESEEKVKAPALPKSIQARVISDSELKHLQDKKAKKQAEALKKKRLEQKRLEKKRLEKKRLEQKRKRDAEKKRLEKQKAKKEAERKKLIAKKKAEEKKAKEKRAQEQKKAEEARRAKELKQRELEKQLALEKQRALEEAQQAEAEKQRLKQESKLLERMRQLELAKQKQAAEAAHSAQQQAQLERELTEVEKYTALIRSKLENRWRKTPKSKGLSAVLRLVLLPTGELVSASLTRSSGNEAFDLSVMHAAESVGTYSVPSDNEVFERYFRTFSIRFAPDE